MTQRCRQLSEYPKELLHAVTMTERRRRDGRMLALRHVQALASGRSRCGLGGLLVVRCSIQRHSGSRPSTAPHARGGTSGCPWRREDCGTVARVRGYRGSRRAWLGPRAAPGADFGAELSTATLVLRRQGSETDFVND